MGYTEKKEMERAILKEFNWPSKRIANLLGDSAGQCQVALVDATGFED